MQSGQLSVHLLYKAISTWSGFRIISALQVKVFCFFIFVLPLFERKKKRIAQFRKFA